MSDGEGTAPADLLGSQRPTHELLCPATELIEGARAIKLAEASGLHLFPWQQYLIGQGMGLGDNGLWSAFEVCVVVSRQNGKSTMLAARALAGLFLLGEHEIVWSAHRYDTAMSAFKLMRRLITKNPELRGELARTRNEGISTTHGDESITLHTGAKISFKTRTTDGGRGLGGDCVFIDEVQAARESHLSALLPTLGAKANPQVWYVGSAGGPRSSIEGDLVHRALSTEPDDPARERLYYAGWSADPDEDDRAAPATWAKVNPSYGLCLLPETMAGFYNSWRYKPDYFDAEHLGIGNYPRPEGEQWIIPSAAWLRREDPDVHPVGEPVLAVDGTPDLRWSSISSAGFTQRAAVHLSVVAHEHGSRWILPRLVELRDTLGSSLPIVMDARSPLAYLVTDMRELGLPVRLLTPDECADATAWFLEAGTEQEPDDLTDTTAWEPSLVHPPQELLTMALAAASVRSRSDRVVISRQAGQVPVSPLTSAVHAGWGLQLLGRMPSPPPEPQPIGSSTVRPRTGPGLNFSSMNF